MVSIYKISGITESGILEINALSTDEMPLKEFQGHPIKNGSTLMQFDIGKLWKYDAENHIWYPQN